MQPERYGIAFPLAILLFLPAYLYQRSWRTTDIDTAVLCALSTVNALWNLKSKTPADGQGQPDDRK